MKYQYLVTDPVDDKRANQLGNQGWRLVCSCPSAILQFPQLYWLREVPEVRDHGSV